MKILVIGGMHGNEPLGLEVVKLFKANPVKDIYVILANEVAVEKSRRFVKKDMNRAFPGNAKSRDYEEKRASELLKLCKKYELVLDFHNTHCPNNDCTFVGNYAKDFLFDVSSWLGLKRVIIADYDCINKFAPNCISIEVSLSSKLMKPPFWFKRIIELANARSIPKQRGLKKYRFVYRVTLEDRDRLQLDKKKLKAFKALSKELANVMGLQSPAYPIFIGDSYTPYYYGGLLNRIQARDGL